jgi:hypothetical protein
VPVEGGVYVFRHFLNLPIFQVAFSILQTVFLMYSSEKFVGSFSSGFAYRAP